MGRILDEGRRLVDFRQPERGGTCDVDEDAARAIDGAGFEQGRCHGRLGGLAGTVLAGALACGHDGVAHAGHGGLHVGEVAVDDAGNGNDVGDALDALAKDVVGDAEALEEACVLGDSEELLVGDDDDGVDSLEEFLEPTLGLHHAALALKAEGAGDDCDGERAHFTGERGDDRSCACACAAAEAGGDEHHVCALERFDDLVGVFEGRAPAYVRISAGAETAGELDAELELHRSHGALKSLHVRVGRDELYALNVGRDHAIDGVVAAAADTNHLDARAARHVVVIVDSQIFVGHHRGLYSCWFKRRVRMGNSDRHSRSCIGSILACEAVGAPVQNLYCRTRCSSLGSPCGFGVTRAGSHTLLARWKTADEASWMQINSQVVKSTIVAGLGGLLFGFDTVVVSGTTAALTDLYHLTPTLLGVTVASALVGTVFGAMFAGIPGQRIGRRDSLRWMAVLYIVSAIGCAFAWDWNSLIVFRVLGGIGIGGSSVLGPMYISELAPTQWRGRLVGFFQVNIVVGILIAYVSNYLLDRANLGAAEWRWQLGVAAIPALLFFVMLFTIPRSPRWLVMVDRASESLAVLQQLGEPDPRRRLERIQADIAEERSAAAVPLFTRRHTIGIFVAITVGAFVQLSGINAILYYLNDIFKLSGASSVSSYQQSIAVGATNLVATLAAMSLIDRIGRKKLLVTGTVGLMLCLLVVGYIFQTNTHQGWLLALLMIYIACFAVSQGAVVWVYISEVFPTAVRAKGQALGSSSHWIFNAVISYAFPVMSRTSRSLPFYFFAAMMALDLILVTQFYPGDEQCFAGGYAASSGWIIFDPPRGDPGTGYGFA